MWSLIRKNYAEIFLLINPGLPISFSAMKFCLKKMAYLKCMSSAMKALLSGGGKGEQLWHCFKDLVHYLVMVVVVVKPNIRSHPGSTVLTIIRRLSGSSYCCKHKAIDFSWVCFCCFSLCQQSLAVFPLCF